MREESKTVEAMKQALERVDRAIDEPNITMSDGKALKEIFRQLHLIKDAIHAAIAEAENHGPIAWIYTDAKGRDVIIGTNTAPYEDAIPLYTHPPRREWVSLTDEEISAAALLAGCDPERDCGALVAALARAIEAKLKEKNS